MRLLLASSRDGFLCRGADDDMRWTGSADKFAFKLLTMSDCGAPLLAGGTTFDMLPPLPGRHVLRLSRQPREFGKHHKLDLHVAAQCFPRAWLIGGPTVAEEALRLGMVKSAFICVAAVDLEGGVPIRPLMEHMPKKPCHRIRFDGVEVLVYSEGGKWPAR
jgi:dihydrofolate reductase